jgi:hypothetical protein
MQFRRLPPDKPDQKNRRPGVIDRRRRHKRYSLS